jgi:DNA-binding transcriptional regulator YdaS (Cro superfamily)
MSSTDGLKIAMRKAGGLRALARKIGVAHTSILHWIEKDEVPAGWLIAIEKVTGVPPHKLRPDLFKHYQHTPKKLELA